MARQNPDSPDLPAGSAPDEAAVEPSALLSLLGDDYTQAILSAMGDESLPAREIAARADVSRPTVYRRLNRLEAAGAVETVLTVDADGHHRQAFRVRLDELAVPLVDPSAAEATPDEDSSESSANPQPSSALHHSS